MVALNTFLCLEASSLLHSLGMYSFVRAWKKEWINEAYIRGLNIGLLCRCSF